MVKFGILADTHIQKDTDAHTRQWLLHQLKDAFRDVDEIIHAGDVCDEEFIHELNQIAPTKCVVGNMDDFKGESFLKIPVGKYNIGIIHEPPKVEDMKDFFNNKNIHILIHGHTHQPLIEGTPYNTLVINPGSPTKPKAPSQKRGFDKPVARATVVTLNIDEDDLLTTFIINLKK